MTITIDIKSTPRGPIFFASASYEESRWLGDHGWWFYGQRSRNSMPLPLNTRWLPVDKHAVAAQLLGADGVEWSDAARARVEETQQAIADSRATDAEVDVPTPEGLELRGYQRAGIKFALDAFGRGQRGVIVGDEMGLGKTMQAIGAAVALGAEKLLVVCPASLCLNWQREIELWWPEVAGQAQVLGAAGGIDPWARVVILNYEKAVGGSKRAKDLRKDLLGTTWNLAVFDEAHLLKNPKAQRTRFFLGHYDRGKLKAEGLAQQVERFLILTGTPIQNRVVESLTLLRAIGAIPGPIASSEFGFFKRFCGAYEGPFGWDFSGATNLDELQGKLRAGWMVRRLKAQVATELPPKIRCLIPFATQGDEIARLKAPSVGFDEATGQLRGTTRDFEEISAYRAELAGYKVQPTVEHVAGLLEDGQKVIVFGHHRVMLDGLTEAFGEQSIRIDGSVPPAARQGLVDRFQDDPAVRVAILSTHAAGVGLTLTAASLVVFAEADWNPSWCVQAEDRAHRIGQTADVVTIQYLTLDGTLDAHVLKTMVGKLDIADRALDRQTAAPKVLPRPKSHSKALARPLGPNQVEIKAGIFTVTPEIKTAAIEGLLILAGRCDGAVQRDGVGFNGMDARSEFVQRLVEAAGQGSLTDRQAAWALKILGRYRKTQLSHLSPQLWGCPE